MSCGCHSNRFEAEGADLDAISNPIVPMIARSLRIGTSAVHVRVEKYEGFSPAPFGDVAVRLDPEVIVVPVHVVYVVPHPQTPTATPSQHGFLDSAIGSLAKVGVSASLAGGALTTSGGHDFADLLLDATSNNDYQSASAPGGLPTHEQATFEWHPILQEDAPIPPYEARALLAPYGGNGRPPWVLPDSLWAQCGIQFRVASVSRVVETDPSLLYLDPSAHTQYCGNSFLNDARIKDALEKWRSAAGIDPSLPGVELVFTPRIDAPNSDNLSCSRLGVANPGFAMVALNPRGFLNSTTVAHELGHTLGLDDYSESSSAPQDRCHHEPSTSNLMCTDAAHTGHHISGCESWRTDSLPGFNCRPNPENDLGDSYTCNTARSAARAASGTVDMGPVSCPEPPFDTSSSEPAMVEMNGMTGLAAYAGGRLTINDRARLIAEGGSYGIGPWASAGVKRSSLVGNDSRLGTLFTDGSRADFAHRYIVDSIVASHDVQLSAQDNRNLEAITSRGAVVPYLELHADFPAQRFADIDLQPGQQFPQPGFIVQPGSYIGNVAIKRDAVLRLGAGRYYFDTLDVQSGGILSLDHSAGHIEIWVRNRFHFNGRMLNAGGDPNANLVMVMSDSWVDVLEAFRGTLVVPRGSINAQNKIHYGAFYAGENLTLHQGGAIHFRPLACNP